MLEDGVSELLVSLAGSSQRQGEYLLRLIRQIYAGEQELSTGTDVEQLRLGYS